MSKSDNRTTHKGCAYSTVKYCGSRSCKPKEVCPAGHRVWRNWTGGGHHHKEKKK